MNDELLGLVITVTWFMWFNRNAVRQVKHDSKLLKFFGRLSTYWRSFKLLTSSWLAMKPSIQCSGYPQPNLGIILILMGLLLLTHSLQELGLLFSTTKG